MIRVLLYAATASLQLAGAPTASRPCDGLERVAPLNAVEFHAVLDMLATAWNTGRGESGANCFAEQAVYLEPPDRQLHRGRAALRDFFTASVTPPRPHRMTWHHIAFDEATQVGLAEYTYIGGRHYHGVAVIRIERGLISVWREYQYGSPLAWDAFMGPSRF
jgi:hypothetical protein